MNLEIVNKEKQIDNIENESDLSIKELRTVYINEIQRKIPDAISINIEGNKKFFQLIEDENFEKLQEQNALNYNYYRAYYNSEYRLQTNSIEFSFASIENDVNPNFTYSEREQLILDKTNDKTENLKTEITKLKSRKQEIKSWDVKQIFKEIDINPHLSEFSGSPLMRNLLLNGYLNENYNDYISLFHEVNLTKEDFLFEKKVKSGEHLAFDYQLTNIETLLNKIPEKYFKWDGILNFHLLDFLGKNYGKYKNLYDKIIELLSNEKENSIEFIDAYVHRENVPIEIFMQSICKSWEGLIDYLYNSNYTEEKINYYLELLIKFVPTDDITRFQKKVFLKDLIDEKPYFLSMIKNTPENNYYSKITSLFKNLEIKFETINPSTDETKDLFKYVYENHHYQINEDNLELMII